MYKLINDFACDKYYFVIRMIDPADNEAINFVMYSYVDDPAIIALLIKGLTKYDFEVIPKGTTEPRGITKVSIMSINQAVTFFKRLRFYALKSEVKSKVISWTEITEVEF